MPPERSNMRIYISDKKMFASFEEPIAIDRFDQLTTLQGYKDKLLDRISTLFDQTVMEAVLKETETSAENHEKHDEQPKTLSEQPETVPKQPETVLESQEAGADQPTEIFRAPKEKMDQPKSGTTRRKIDYGKIMALHNAGWSNQKIADEMGMTYNAVATAISNYKKKMRVGGGKA